MSKNPLGFMAYMNAMSLMLITPEFYKIRLLRSARAGKPDTKPANLSIKPEYMELDGRKIRFARAGVKTGPTILFLSPMPQSILCYDAVWANLMERANLVAVDLPGFGKSQGTKDDMNFAAQSAFLEKFIQALSLQDVHIVAPDIAMPVALHHAIHADQKPASILVGDGPGILPSADGSIIRKIMNSSFWRTIVRLNGAKTFISTASQLGYLHYSPTKEELLDYISSYAGRLGPVNGYFKQYPKGCQALTQQIEQLELPVQVFWADEDAFLGAENAVLLHSHLQNSALHIFENCGHFCNQDKSDEFTEMLQKWTAGGYAQL
jgi:pimeloyl-ACP methyl ester carboxylesterase